MKPSTYLIRFRRLLLLGAVVAGVAVPAAGAVVRPPDVQDAANSLYATTQGLKADGLRMEGIAQVYRQVQLAPTAAGMKAEGERLQGIAQVYQQLQPVPDVFERYAAAHPNGRDLVGPSTPSAQVSRPPDVADAALTAQYGSSVQSSTDFDWGDWAIGIGSGIGLALLAGTGLVTGRQFRQRLRTA